MRRYCLLLVSVLVMTGCQKTFHTEGFSVVIPDSAEVTKQSPVEDFDLYVFGLRGQPFLSAYAGNQPSFPPAQTNGPSKASETDKTINGCPARMVVLTHEGGLPESHVLVHLRTTGWPEFLHFWYTNNSPAQASLADAIISSAKPE